jgi:hypothetical protein
MSSVDEISASIAPAAAAVWNARGRVDSRYQAITPQGVLTSS